ncbi:LacI family DNA-binding transcriptional regulator [Deinococcus sp. KSM4-11]|uniref:substrate-binding domain-containing protein n=1 Tax=Deinococcus sp. KSM4-11 TaxID=2568654 RepID=UPI0010A5703A|nr:substrate-binding domain-containing protein [Deinococcus sp. KSM4-11]THF83555.1 LacI family DNA-binding transcriptional regulator [Deinococcus sp. KSM4-11]
MPPAKPSAPSTAPPPRGGRITLREVARALGVSVATVSNAYNRPDQLSEELRERILETARTLGYRGPDPLARSLRRGRTGVIGVVYDAPLEYAFADPAAALFLGSVTHAIQDRALNLLLLASPEDVMPVRSASVDAFIVYCAAENSDLLRAVLDRGLPTVLVDQYAHPQAVQIGIDDAGGAREAARHLRDLGHEHIGIVCLELGPERHSGPVTPERERAVSYRTTAERLHGYRSGAQGAVLYPVETEQNTPQEGETRALELLAAHPDITGLLCMSDVLAQGALRAAKTLGRSVPDDLSIIGYDDLPSSTTFNLTTVWQPTTDKGRHVGEALLDLLSGSAAENVTLPTRLVVRGTTAPGPRTR